MSIPRNELRADERPGESDTKCPTSRTHTYNAPSGSPVFSTLETPSSTSRARAPLRLADPSHVGLRHRCSAARRALHGELGVGHAVRDYGHLCLHACEHVADYETAAQHPPPRIRDRAIWVWDAGHCVRASSQSSSLCVLQGSGWPGCCFQSDLGLRHRLAERLELLGRPRRGLCSDPSLLGHLWAEVDIRHSFNYHLAWRLCVRLRRDILHVDTWEVHQLGWGNEDRALPQRVHRMRCHAEHRNNHVDPLPHKRDSPRLCSLLLEELGGHDCEHPAAVVRAEQDPRRVRTRLHSVGHRPPHRELRRQQRRIPHFRHQLTNRWHPVRLDPHPSRPGHLHGARRGTDEHADDAFQPPRARSLQAASGHADLCNTGHEPVHGAPLVLRHREQEGQPARVRADRQGRGHR